MQDRDFLTVLLTDVGDQQHGKVGPSGEANQIPMKEEDEKEENKLPGPSKTGETEILINEYRDFWLYLQ